MIKKINKIKNLGLVFSDYSWNLEKDYSFKKFNLFYGWNGCGKTTLSRLFLALGNGAVPKDLKLEYEIEMDTGRLCRQGDNFDKKIRVFNRDYISKNIKLMTGEANPIFILGEDNKILIEQIRTNENSLSAQKIELNSIDNDIKNLTSKKSDKFTEVARNISINIFGILNKKYDKKSAEAEYNKCESPSKDMLEEEVLRSHKLTLNQKENSIIDELKIFKTKDLQTDSEKPSIIFVDELILKSKELLKKTVEVMLIDRLKENPDISGWVEQGLELHHKHKSKNCEFCLQSVPDNRLKELTEYFNEADKALKGEIEKLIKNLNNVRYNIEKFSIIDKSRLYEDFWQSYQLAVDQFIIEKETSLKNIKNIIDLLEIKKNKTTERMYVEVDVNSQQLSFRLEAINFQIQNHNHKANNFLSEKEKAINSIKKHYLSLIRNEITNIDSNLQNLYKQKEDKTNSISLIEREIKEHQSRLSSLHIGCDEINKRLKTFLGRDEIVFESKQNGYIIKINGKIVDALSEGEKTAIGLIYFIVHLLDMDFSVKEGIIVIDDPVSSLDSNSQFQAFSFIKNALEDAYQCFIFTHNFEFLRLMMDWMKHLDKNYYMIKNKHLLQGELTYKRTAIICPLDAVLFKYKTEYLYLFSLLRNFKLKQEENGHVDDLTEIYFLPNIARKFLETFLMFMVPNSEQLPQKLKRIKFNRTKKDAIHKFVNHASHLTGKDFDPSLFLESKNVILHLFEMVQTVFKEHYDILEENFQTSNMKNLDQHSKISDKRKLSKTREPQLNNCSELA